MFVELKHCFSQCSWLKITFCCCCLNSIIPQYVMQSSFGLETSLCVYSMLFMADKKSLLLEAQTCVGSDNMFKGCDRANPLWRKPCVESKLACWWGLLRCCQRHHDNSQSMQNRSRSIDASGWINYIRSEPQTLIMCSGSSSVTQRTHPQRWEVRGTFSVQEIKHSRRGWPCEFNSTELNPPLKNTKTGALSTKCTIASFGILKCFISSYLI